MRALSVVLALALLAPAAPATAAGGPFTPGSAGIGDPQYPTDGNGGYDVRHYDLAVRYQPAATTSTATPRSPPPPRRACPGSTSTSWT